MTGAGVLLSPSHGAPRGAADSQGRPLSLAEQIAEHIARDILAGELKPGDGVLEQRVAEALGVSRGPIREALRILEKEGVVVVVPRKGAKVSHLEPAEVNGIFEMRSALYARAARRFALARSDAQLAAIRAHQARMNALPADDPSNDHVDLSSAMAQIMIQNCGNARLATLLNLLQRQVARYTTLGLSSPTRRAESRAGWRALIDAIEARDAGAAERIAGDMVANTHRFAVGMLARAQDGDGDGDARGRP